MSEIERDVELLLRVGIVGRVMDVANELARLLRALIARGDIDDQAGVLGKMVDEIVDLCDVYDKNKFKEPFFKEAIHAQLIRIMVQFAIDDWKKLEKGLNQ